VPLLAENNFNHVTRTSPRRRRYFYC
jgi:hypothetical protein